MSNKTDATFHKGVTHGPLFYRLADDLVVWTCDCGHETPGYVLFEDALKSLNIHLSEVREVAE